jgi:hypothetical protein
MDSLLALLHWLLLPLSGASNHQIEPAVFWHARLMVLAWGVCLPLGALVSRYFKVMPRQDWPRVLDNKAWWHAHRTLQYTGIFSMTLGLWLVYAAMDADSVTHQLHRWAGWCVIVAAWFQMVGGIWRGSKGGPTDTQIRGDHYDMTPWRCAFERVHKSVGWLAILSAIPVTLLGLLIADAPRWMLLLLATWWLALAGIALLLQRKGVCLDTYQAIWGNDSSMPGLKRAPIGWGVGRHSANPWSTPHHK